MRRKLTIKGIFYMLFIMLVVAGIGYIVIWFFYTLVEMIFKLK